MNRRDFFRRSAVPVAAVLAVPFIAALPKDEPLQVTQDGDHVTLSTRGTLTIRAGTGLVIDGTKRPPETPAVLIKSMQNFRFTNTSVEL